MKNGRINERNIGYTKLDGGAKRTKAISESVLTDEQYNAKETVRLCNMILGNGIRLYENIPELVNHWITNGIVEIKEIENPWSYARQITPTVKIASLNEKHRSDIMLVKNLLIQFYKI